MRGVGVRVRVRGLVSGWVAVFVYCKWVDGWVGVRVQVGGCVGGLLWVCMCVCWWVGVHVWV